MQQKLLFLEGLGTHCINLFVPNQPFKPISQSPYARAASRIVLCSRRSVPELFEFYLVHSEDEWRREVQTILVENWKGSPRPRRLLFLLHQRGKVGLQCYRWLAARFFEEEHALRVLLSQLSFSSIALVHNKYNTASLKLFTHTPLLIWSLWVQRSPFFSLPVFEKAVPCFRSQ